MRRALLIFLTAVVAMAQQPGAEPYGPALQQQLAAAWSKRPADYRPRTRHLSETGEARYTNRLFLESSPYLLQHAHNPVDWRPWSDEAFELARELGRPVLLSIGYSTCHWCHVMEEESFEDEEIARFINEHYIAIKVDREQRPDIDGVYLAALHAMTGAGGWPMTLWLTPDREPFFAGTYFPPRDGDRGIATGFLTLLDRMQEIYLEQPDAVAQNSSIAAERVTLLLSQTQAGGGPSEAALTAAVSSYKELFDAANGGVQGSPKFPSGLPVRLLLDEYAATKDESLLSMAAATLTGMSQGGIRDHLHGGFHRYATDARWRVPHFEKMLYDNALLASVYIEGRRATGDTAYEAVIRDILRFLAEEMTAPGGGFYSATDADSLNPETAEREEGFYFTWTPEELEQALGPEDAAIASAVWSITDEGDLDGRNILRRNRSPADVARELKLTEGVVAERIPGIERRMRAAREGRPKPLRDDKILAAWNGYAISAFAEAAFALEEPGYADSARRAARFLLEHMRVDGRLQRSYFGGAVSGEGYLDDYAAVIAGLISLYEVTAEVEWLQGAIELDRVLAERFAAPSGGYYLTGADHEKLIVRQQVAYDEAEPSGNSVQALNLLRLHEVTTDDAYRERADKLLAAFSSTLDKSPADLSEMLRAVRWRLSKPKQLVFVGPTVEQARRLASEMRWSHAPQSVMVIAAESDVDSLSATIPLLAGKRAIAGQATAYVCEERVCKLPTSDPAKLRELVAE